MRKKIIQALFFAPNGQSELLLFNSFRISGIKHFIASNDKKIVRKVLKGLELADQKDNKLTLVKLKVTMKSDENLAENETKKLSETAQDLFHLTQSYKLCERVDA